MGSVVLLYLEWTEIDERLQSDGRQGEEEAEIREAGEYHDML